MRTENPKKTQTLFTPVHIMYLNYYCYKKFHQNPKNGTLFTLRVYLRTENPKTKKSEPCSHYWNYIGSQITMATKSFIKTLRINKNPKNRNPVHIAIDLHCRLFWPSSMASSSSSSLLRCCWWRKTRVCCVPGVASKIKRSKLYTSDRVVIARQFV